jgi:hypothetical protein
MDNLGMGRQKGKKKMNGGMLGKQRIAFRCKKTCWHEEEALSGEKRRK